MVDISFGPEPGQRLNLSDPTEAYIFQSRRKRLYSFVLLILFVALMVSGFRIAENRNAGDFITGLRQLPDFPAEVLSEAWANRANLPGLVLKFLPSLLETINIAAVSTLIGVILGGFLSLGSTRHLARYPALTPLFRRLSDILRAIPEIVIALVLIFILGGGPVPAVIAIGLHTAGALAKLFSESAENADLKPVEGLASTGANWSQQMWLGILPQVAPNWLSYTLLRFEINVRASAILGFVGSGGIGYDLKLALQWGGGKYDEVVAIFLLLFFAIVFFDQLSSYARNRLVKGARSVASSGSTTHVATVEDQFRLRRLTALAVPTLLLAYLTYIFFSFDVPGLAQRARLDNAQILLADFVSHKTHVTRDNRSGALTIAIEGENKGTYGEGQMPDWVQVNGDETIIHLGRGHVVTYDAQGARYEVPDYGTIDIRPEGGKLLLTAPQPIPDWINVSDTRISVTTAAGRFAYSRSKVETFKYEPGWELFFFTLDSPFYGKSYGELTALLTQPRLDPARSNLAYMAQEFWGNKMWHHSDVAWALFETVLMAFLGTMSAALLALPLAFLAASNFTPFRALRFAVRRLFDFVRGVDGLIWTIVLARAFGPGPMTGALAIMLTDTGTFGKTFSEALENIDEKQVEGIRSTGANAVQRARFGVIPQVAPILLSQVLYYFESNTRSATVIGAIVGGGIGLLLTQAIITQKDWEEVAYYMILIVLMVMAMDSASGWIRRKFIGR